MRGALPASSLSDTHDDLRPHVVAVPFLTQGHINPLMHFCLDLAANGITVTFVEIVVQGGQFPRLREQQGLEALRFESLPLVLPEDSNFLTNDGVRRFFQALEDLEAPFEQLMQRLSSEKRPRVCCVVSDCMFKCTQRVAKRFGIPRAAFWTAAAAALSVDYHAPLLMANGDIPITESNKDKIISYVPGLSPLRAFDVPRIYHVTTTTTSTALGNWQIIPRSNILKDDTWVIANSFQELEPDAFDALRKEMNDKCIGVGPLLPPAFLGLEQQDSIAHSRIAPGVASLWKQEMDCLKWLDAQAPNSVLYVSFGSAVSISNEDFQQLAQGLEASQQAFLWAVRTDSVTGISQAVLESFIERIESKSLVISWAPQVEVLSHASTGAFLTHCGWNSVLEGICGGVPMLGWPSSAEQNFNCKVLVDDMRVGLRLLNDSWSTTKDEIANKVVSILNDQEMRERVGKLKNAARKSRADGGSSQVSLQAFVDDIRRLAAGLS